MKPHQVKKLHKRTQRKIAEDRMKVVELLMRETPVTEIARQLGLTRDTVRQDVMIVEKEWREQNAERLDILKYRELSRLNYVGNQAWKAWEKSKGKSVVTTKEAIEGDADGKGKKSVRKRASERTETQNGDPRYLQIVVGVIEARRKLLGLDEPVRLADADGGNLPTPIQATVVRIILPDNGRENKLINNGEGEQNGNGHNDNVG